MIYLGHLHYFLGLQFLQSKECVSLSQSKCSYDLLRLFHMEQCKLGPSPYNYRVKLSFTCTSLKLMLLLYHHLVGGLLCLTHTHLDISFAIGLVARYMKNHHESHWKEEKRIVQYVQRIVQFGIHYSLEVTPLLVSFTGSDWASDPYDRNSTIGYVFTLGLVPITWACKKQKVISLYLAEVDYHATPLGSCSCSIS